MAGVEVEARKLLRPEPEARTWPPLEPVKRYQIPCLRESLLDRMKILSIKLHRSTQEVANLVIEAGLDQLEKDVS